MPLSMSLALPLSLRYRLRYPRKEVSDKVDRFLSFQFAKGYQMGIETLVVDRTVDYFALPIAIPWCMMVDNFDRILSSKGVWRRSQEDSSPTTLLF